MTQLGHIECYSFVNATEKCYSFFYYESENAFDWHNYVMFQVFH